jgi:hypothetical protein
VDASLVAVLPAAPPSVSKAGAPPPGRSGHDEPSSSSPDAQRIGESFEDAGAWSSQADVEEASEPRLAPRVRSKDLSSGGRVVQLSVSAAFVELLRKLEAFDALVAAGKYQKAALVADDLTDAISRFDPRVYFPDLFATFGKGLAENIEILGEHWGERESLGWKALEQFYRVDIKRFVDG